MKDRQGMHILAAVILIHRVYRTMKVTSAGMPGLSFKSAFGMWHTQITHFFEQAMQVITGRVRSVFPSFTRATVRPPNLSVY